jgi:hypothetical protein
MMMTTIDRASGMLTIADVARELGISVRSVHRLLGRELPVVNVTARRRGVLEADLAAYIAERRVVGLSGGLPLNPMHATSPTADLVRAERAYFAHCAASPRRAPRRPAGRA